MSQRKSPLRGSVTQNNLSVRMREQDESGVSFLARLGLLGLLILSLVGGAVYLWHIEWPQRKAKQIGEYALELTQMAKFEVRDVVVEGRVQSSKGEVIDALGAKRGAAILGIDMQAAAERLGKLPWVGTAIVERRLPDTVAVILKERVPTARWQNDGKFFVLDKDGAVLPSAKAGDFADLPLVIGAGADKKANALFNALAPYPAIRAKISSAIRVGERRWDLRVEPKITIRLPEQGMDGALHRLSVLIEQERILDQDILAIDLRIPDRLAIEPAPKAAAETRP